MTRTVAFLLISSQIVSLRCGGSEPQAFSERRVLMGTLVNISLYADKEPDGWRQDVGRAFAEMDRVEKLMSVKIPDSEIGQINRHAGRDYVSAHPQVVELLAQARSIAEVSAGAFDVTVWPLLRLWDFDSEKPHVPAHKDLENALKLVDYTSVALSDSSVRLDAVGSGIDLGAIAKGYAVDRAADVLSGIGYTDFMVEAGGDLRAVAGKRTRGRRKIWIQHPRIADDFFAYFEMDEGAVATSGDYERFFEQDGKRYHHILNPETGYPAETAISTTVVAANTAVADAFSTAVFVLGPDRGLRLIESLVGVEALVVFADDMSGELKWNATSQLKSKLVILNN